MEAVCGDYSHHRWMRRYCGRIYEQGLLLGGCVGWLNLGPNRSEMVGKTAFLACRGIHDYLWNSVFVVSSMINLI